MMATHELRDEQVHYTWSARHEPRLRVRPGDSVRLVTRDGFDGQMAGVSGSELDANPGLIDFSRVAPLTGPIFIEGARPGDVAVVRIDRLAPLGAGWTVIWPAWSDFDFARPHGLAPGAHVIEFDAGSLGPEGVVELDGARVRLRPMLGMVGTAPARGEFNTLPPRAFGGNMDLRLVAEGATVYLPVFAEGALVSLGDGHAAQGDGEVCTTAIECGMSVEVTLDLRRGRIIEEPEVETRDAYLVTAFGRDLDTAARKAIRFMHRHLVEVRGLRPEIAYAFMSLAGNLGVNQVVDTPHVGVRFSIPLEAIER
jgi:acetamidase/formamidase